MSYSLSSLPFRGAFADSTNHSNRLSNSNSKPKHLRLSSQPPGSRKSLPVCTVSLTNASVHVALSSPSSSGVKGISTIDFESSSSSSIPFPSSPSNSSPSNSPPISKPDQPPNPHALLRSDPLPTRPRARVRASPVEGRRRRSMAKLTQPIATPVPTPHPSLTTEDPQINSPPRKRQRKCVKRPTSDLRFQAIVQRSVAWSLTERRRAVWGMETGGVEGDWDKSAEFDAQDTLLVRRLRTYLIEKGYEAETIDLDIDIVVDSSSVDVDMDVDIDVEAAIRPSAPQSDLLSSRPLPAPHQRILPSSQLVAALIFRNRHTDKDKERPSPEANPAGSSGEAAAESCRRKSSPLAMFELCSSDSASP